MKQEKPRVSIIIPVFNDKNRIIKCIKSLINQKYPRKLYEIIIVDNGSTDGTVKVLKNFPVKIILEHKIKSSYAARNKGIRYASNEILAFTDSDVIVNQNWLENGIKALINHNIYPDKRKVVVGIARPLENPYLNHFSLYDYITAFRHQFKTWNLFAFKNTFHEIGFFNEKLISGGDSEWGARVVKNGFIIEKAKNVVVYHPLRSSFKSIIKKQFRTGYGSGQLLKFNLEYSNYNKSKFRVLLKEPIKAYFWIKSTIKIIKEFLKEDKKILEYFLPLFFITIIFSIITSFNRLRGLMGKKF